MEGEAAAFYVFDERMLKHVSLPSEEPPHVVYNCPEVPDRAKRIHEYLKDKKMLD